MRASGVTAELCVQASREIQAASQDERHARGFSKRRNSQSRHGAPVGLEIGVDGAAVGDGVEQLRPHRLGTGVHGQVQLVEARVADRQKLVRCAGGGGRHGSEVERLRPVRVAEGEAAAAPAEAHELLALWLRHAAQHLPEGLHHRVCGAERPAVDGVAAQGLDVNGGAAAHQLLQLAPVQELQAADGHDSVEAAADGAQLRSALAQAGGNHAAGKVLLVLPRHALGGAPWDELAQRAIGQPSDHPLVHPLFEGLAVQGEHAPERLLAQLVHGVQVGAGQGVAQNGLPHQRRHVEGQREPRAQGQPHEEADEPEHFKVHSRGGRGAGEHLFAVLPKVAPAVGAPEEQHRLARRQLLRGLVQRLAEGSTHVDAALASKVHGPSLGPGLAVAEGLEVGRPQRSEHLAEDCPRNVQASAARAGGAAAARIAAAPCAALCGGRRCAPVAPTALLPRALGPPARIGACCVACCRTARCALGCDAVHGDAILVPAVGLPRLGTGTLGLRGQGGINQCHLGRSEQYRLQSQQKRRKRQVCRRIRSNIALCNRPCPRRRRRCRCRCRCSCRCPGRLVCARGVSLLPRQALVGSLGVGDVGVGEERPQQLVDAAHDGEARPKGHQVCAFQSAAVGYQVVCGGRQQSGIHGGGVEAEALAKALHHIHQRAVLCKGPAEAGGALPERRVLQLPHQHRSGVGHGRVAQLAGQGVVQRQAARLDVRDVGLGAKLRRMVPLVPHGSHASAELWDGVEVEAPEPDHEMGRAHRSRQMDRARQLVVGADAHVLAILILHNRPRRPGLGGLERLGRRLGAECHPRRCRAAMGSQLLHVPSCQREHDEHTDGLSGPGGQGAAGGIPLGRSLSRQRRHVRSGEIVRPLVHARASALDQRGCGAGLVLGVHCEDQRHQGTREATGAAAEGQLRDGESGGGRRCRIRCRGASCRGRCRLGRPRTRRGLLVRLRSGLLLAAAQAKHHAGRAPRPSAALTEPAPARTSWSARVREAEDDAVVHIARVEGALRVRACHCRGGSANGQHLSGQGHSAAGDASVADRSRHRGGRQAALQGHVQSCPGTPLQCVQPRRLQRGGLQPAVALGGSEHEGKLPVVHEHAAVAHRPRVAQHAYSGNEPVAGMGGEPRKDRAGVDTVEHPGHGAGVNVDAAAQDRARPGAHAAPSARVGGRSATERPHLGSVPLSSDRAALHARLLRDGEGRLDRAA
mmetsp:Transcript_11845/g.46254  ORF Transcript_11845/g.46254 Transcript_11845/m.46254 type:complete len:1205 (+) Transcript_11845:203-3817(+)